MGILILHENGRNRKGEALEKFAGAEAPESLFRIRRKSGERL
jgi:hypothetical protein